MIENKKYKIIAVSRIKDSILTISEFLYRLTNLVDAIVIIDNGSTDGTKEVYKYFDDFILEIKDTEGFNEGRDRILGLELARKYNPEWILYLDSDELFEEGFRKKELTRLLNKKNTDVYVFRLFHFWNSKIFYRFDKKYLNYTLNYQPRLARNIKEIYMKDKIIHSGFFYGALRGRIKKHSARLLHYGYIYKKQINDKRKFYSSIDKYTNRTYDHLIISCKRKMFIESNFLFLNNLIRFLIKIHLDIIFFIVRVFNKLKKFFRF